MAVLAWLALEWARTLVPRLHSEAKMRRLIGSEFMSLDGVIQAPGGAEEDTDGGFTLGGWTIPYWHDDLGARTSSRP